MEEIEDWESLLEKSIELLEEYDRVFPTPPILKIFITVYYKKDLLSPALNNLLDEVYDNEQVMEYNFLKACIENILENNEQRRNTKPTE